MAPRRRNPGRKDWPDNLTAYTDKRTGRTYYSYKHPDTGERFGFGTDKIAAFAAARELNQRLVGENPLVAKVLGEMTVQRAYESFRDEFLPTRDWAESTRYNHELHVRHFADARGDWSLRSITVQECARFLDGFPNRSSNAHRASLLHYFRYCMSKGWIESNPAQVTIPKQETVQRQRLESLAVYKQIWLKASPPIRDAMDLSLKTLQARLEISELKFEKYNKETRKLRVVRQKTKKASAKRFLRGLEPVAFIEITADDELHAIIERCRNNVVSAYMVHQVVKNEKRRAKKLSPESISRGFAKARDATGLFDTMPPAQRPTFHEIRSLGAELLRKQGWPEERIQQLLGHTDSAMTKKYLEGHEIPFVEVTL